MPSRASHDQHILRPLDQHALKLSPRLFDALLAVRSHYIADCGWFRHEIGANESGVSDEVVFVRHVLGIDPIRARLCGLFHAQFLRIGSVDPRL